MRVLRHTMLVAAGLLAAMATPALAQESPVLVAIDTGTTIEFVSEETLNELEQTFKDVIAPLLPVQPVPETSSAGIYLAVMEYGDFTGTSSRPSSECSNSGYICAGLVQTNRSSLDSWRWRVNDTIQWRNARVLGVSFRMTIA